MNKNTMQFLDYKQEIKNGKAFAIGVPILVQDWY